MNEDNKALIKALNDELELAKSLTKGLRNALIEAYDLIMELKAPKEDPEKDDFETLLQKHNAGCKQFTVYETVGEHRRPIESGLIDVSDCTSVGDQNRMLQSHLEYLKTVRSDWADKILSINCPLANHLR